MTAQIVITYPLPGDSVSVPFTAYGTITNGSNVAGSLTPPNGTAYYGSTVTEGPNWRVAFSQPTGSFTRITLKIWCTDPGNGFAQTSIGCNPPNQL